MPVLIKIRDRFAKERVFEGLTFGICLHLEMKTAVLAKVLKASGATVAITGSNPLTTHDDVAAALAQADISVYAWRGETEEEHKENLLRVLRHKPDIIIDDGADLSIAAYLNVPEAAQRVIGACEETTTGVLRFKALERDGLLKFPVVAVNDAYTKFLFDSQHGTGQSALEGIMRATNLLLAGKTIVVAGYGWVGRGIAKRAKGLGANVIVTEVDPIRALEAIVEGFKVLGMREAARIGDIFITATGCKDVITEEHMRLMKDGAVLANAGHFDVEVNVKDLERISLGKSLVRPNVKEYLLPPGKRLYLLAEGRLVNLVAADGHPAEVMDMSFANQALAAEYLVKNKGRLEARVYRMPLELDREVARLKLEALGVKIDELTDEQRRYLSSWQL